MIVREPMAYELHCHGWREERWREEERIILVSLNNREKNMQIIQSSKYQLRK